MLDGIGNLSSFFSSIASNVCGITIKSRRCRFFVFEQLVDMIQRFADLLDCVDVVAALGHGNNVFFNRIRNTIIVYNNVSVWQYLSPPVDFLLVWLVKDFFGSFRFGNHLIDFQQCLREAHAGICINRVIFNGKRDFLDRVRYAIIVNRDIAQYLSTFPIIIVANAA